MTSLGLRPAPPRPFGADVAGFIAGAGTWTRGSVSAGRVVGLYGEPRWYEHGSGFAALMHDRYGIGRIDRNGDPQEPDPPLWDGALEGTTAHLLKARILGRTPLERWIVQSKAVVLAVQRVPERVRWVLVFAHSHFGQVAAVGCANLLFARDKRRVILVTVDTPNRRGLQDVYARASKNIGGRWVHLHSGADWGSRMRWLGARCLPWQRQEIGQAGANVAVTDDQDHSGVVSVNMDAGDVETWDRAMRAAGELAAAEGG